jgi:hypothetical protein
MEPGESAFLAAPQQQPDEGSLEGYMRPLAQQAASGWGGSDGGMSAGAGFDADLHFSTSSSAMMPGEELQGRGPLPFNPYRPAALPPNPYLPYNSAPGDQWLAPHLDPAMLAALMHPQQMFALQQGGMTPAGPMIPVPGEAEVGVYADWRAGRSVCVVGCAQT